MEPGAGTATGAAAAPPPPATAESEEWWTEPDAATLGLVLGQGNGSLPRAAEALEHLTRPAAASSLAPLADCKVHVLDVSRDLGPSIGLPPCDLDDPSQWPFAAPGAGIDGAPALRPLDFQYAQEAWLAGAIRNSSRHEPDLARADFVFVDMHCLHLSWVAFNHPQWRRSNATAGREDPAPQIWRATEAVLDLPAFQGSRGVGVALASPTPSLQRFFPEDDVCEELGGVLHLVPERANLCTWTRTAARVDNALLLPYVASNDLALGGAGSDAALLAAPRELHAFFVGGCGNPAPEVRGLFAAGKMLRYELVRALNSETERARGEAAASAAGAASAASSLPPPLASNGRDVLARCACDICEGHLDHAAYLDAMRRATFCPIVASNAQSSRRVSEAALSGCVPVFLGPPFHVLPLADAIDYASFSIFIRVRDAGAWIDPAAPRWDQSALVASVWALAARPRDYDPSSENRVLGILERGGQVATTAAALLFADTNLKPWTPWSWWLIAAIALMVAYEAAWIRYFTSPRTMQDFTRSLLGIPVPLASLPVAAFLLLGVYGRVIWLIAAVVILGIGHIGIHLQHARKSSGATDGPP